MIVPTYERYERLRPLLIAYGRPANNHSLPLQRAEEAAVVMFGEGADTVTIGKILGITEAEASRLLHVAREREGAE